MNTSASGEQVVLYRVDDGVAVVTLNRPDRLNAWTPEMEVAYFDALDAAATDETVRTIVVTGAGRGFCAGADMDALRGLGKGSAWSGSGRLTTHALSIPKPIIAAVNGACAGLGFVHALMCDLRFAAAGAKFTTAFVRRGLIAEHGSSWILPRLIGHARALDLLLSGRVLLSDEALALGLVNRVVPAESLLADTLAYARDLAANCSPAAMATIKSQVYRHWDEDLGPSLAESNALMAKSLREPDFREGVSSFVERRAPRFGPLTAGSKGYVV
jgi:enoyl-CoA hydratase/carnithine racemase